MQELHMSADDFFLNIIVIIISVLVHIDRKNSDSCFLFIFLFRKYNLLILLYI